MVKRKAIPKIMRMKVFERDNWICQSCGVKTHNEPLKRNEMKDRGNNHFEQYDNYLEGKRINKNHNWHKAAVDHIIPYDLGGEDDIKNYQTLCTCCNSMKHNKPYPKGFNIKLYTLVCELRNKHYWYLNQIDKENEQGYCRLKRHGDFNSSNYRRKEYEETLNDFRDYIDEVEHINFNNEWYGLFTKQQEKHFKSFPRTTTTRYYPVRTEFSYEI